MTTNDTIKTAFARKGLMPVAEAAEKSGYTVTHLLRLFKSGRLAGEKAGPKAHYISRVSLATFLGETAAEAVGLDQPLEGETATPTP